MARAKKNDSDRPVVDMLRPRDPKGSLAIAKEYVAGGTPSLEQGRFTKEELRERFEKSQAGKGRYPFSYDPVVSQIGKERGAHFAVPGQPKKYPQEPENWSGKLGKWFEGAHYDKYRLSHNVDVRDNCVPDSVVAVGKHEYVIGIPGMAAPFAINGAERGNYEANVEATQQLTYAEMVTESGKKVTKTEFNTVVGQINNKPMIIVIDGGDLAVLPNHTVTWGHLSDKSGKVLTPAAIRALKGDDDGITFTALSERWVGLYVTQNDFWKEVQKLMKDKGTKREGEETTLMDRFANRQSRSGNEISDAKGRAWYNLTQVQTRSSPDSLYPYGLRHCLIGKPIGTKFNDSGKERVVFMILGGFSPSGLTQTRWSVNAAAKSVAVAAESTEDVSAKTAKTVKAETVKPKAKAAKAAKPAKAKSAKVKKSGGKKAKPATATVTEAPSDQDASVEEDASIEEIDDLLVEAEAVEETETASAQ